MKSTSARSLQRLMGLYSGFFDKGGSVSGFSVYGLLFSVFCLLLIAAYCKLKIPKPQTSILKPSNFYPLPSTIHHTPSTLRPANLSAYFSSHRKQGLRNFLPQSVPSAGPL